MLGGELVSKVISVPNVTVLPILAISNFKLFPPPFPKAESVIVMISLTAWPVPPSINSIFVSPNVITSLTLNVNVCALLLPSRPSLIVIVSESTKSIPPSNIVTVAFPLPSATISKTASEPFALVDILPACKVSVMSTICVPVTVILPNATPVTAVMPCGFCISYALKVMSGPPTESILLPAIVIISFLRYPVPLLTILTATCGSFPVRSS